MARLSIRSLHHQSIELASLAAQSTHCHPGHVVCEARWAACRLIIISGGVADQMCRQLLIRSIRYYNYLYQNAYMQATRLPVGPSWHIYVSGREAGGGTRVELAHIPTNSDMNLPHHPHCTPFLESTKSPCPAHRAASYLSRMEISIYVPVMVCGWVLHAFGRISSVM